MEAEMRNRLAFLKSCETGNVADAFVRLGMVHELPAYTVDSARCRPFRMEDVWGPLSPYSLPRLAPDRQGPACSKYWPRRNRAPRF